MPIYEYVCGACGYEFEEIQKFSDKPIRTCPQCKKRRVKRLVSKSTFQLKGGGWYADGYAKAQSDAKSDAKSETKSDAKSDAKSETKSDAKSASKETQAPTTGTSAPKGKKGASTKKGASATHAA